MAQKIGHLPSKLKGWRSVPSTTNNNIK
jgi:hypothetical protein